MNILYMAVVQSLVLALAFGPVACGEVKPFPAPHVPSCVPPDCIPPDPELAGTWSGTVSTAGVVASSRTTTIDVTIDEAHVGFYGICPGGEGGFGVDVSGRSAKWTGEVFCDLPTIGCPDARLWLTTGDVRLSTDGRLEVTLFGQHMACDDYTPASLNLKLGH